MNRSVHLAPAVLLLTLLAVAHAQDGRVSLASSGTVVFSVTDADLAAARGCPGCVAVAPDPGPSVVLEVKRQNPNRIYTIDAILGPWNPTNDPTLEVRATITGTDGRTRYLQTDWTPLSGAPEALFTQDDVQDARSVRVALEYRLVLAGDERAGLFTAPVTYRVRENGSSVGHGVQIGLPTFLALRWRTTTPDGGASLHFDYGDDPVTYLEAVTSALLLAPTSADFTGLEVSTNDPRGYSVTVRVVLLDAPTGTMDLRGRLRLADQAADGAIFASNHATDGFVLLLSPMDFRLAVDGGEDAGSYRFELTYEATRNP